MLLSVLAAVALATPCELEAPSDQAFAVTPPEGASRVHLLVEVWTDGAATDWAAATLGALSSRGLAGTLVVPLPPPGGPPREVLALVEQVADLGHEVAVQLPAHEIPRDLAAKLGPLRSRVRPLRKAAGSLRTAAAALPGKPSEALLGRAGFRTFLATNGPPTATPRLAAVFEGEPKTNVVLQSGPYAGDCGTEPSAGPWTPLGADRAAQAVHGAIATPGAPTVRVVLSAANARDTDAAVLGRWLDEVVLPAGVVVTTPEKARRSALAAMRTGEAVRSPLAHVGGRMLAVEQVVDAARALEGVQIMPRTLPHDLSLTEAFQAFLLVLAEKQEGDVIRLAALEGPPTHAESALGQQDVVELPREVVVTFAELLLAELPEAVPMSMRLRGQLLTAPELLGLLASAVRGDDPAVTRISASPDPNARGLGWGSSTTP